MSMRDSDEFEGERHTDAEIARLIERLNSLEEGERTVGKLLSHGRSVIEPLERFLFEGKPGVIYQPRRWAVEVLAGVRAKEVLIAYLRWKKDIADPAVRLAEEVVENEAARGLAHCQTNEVFETLQEIAGHRPQLGFVEALGEFRRGEAISYFIGALEDDVCRPAAEDALRKLGGTAVSSLVEAAVWRVPSEVEETPSSLLRRTSALKLLGEIDLPPAFWQRLRPLLCESHPDVVIGISILAGRIGDSGDKLAAVEHSLKTLASADWFAQGEIEDSLVALYGTGKDAIEGEIARRGALAAGQHIVDRALRTLLRVKRRAEAPQSDR